jgi:SynChlorMet cassette radical SAM/SPASM protein ScmE
MRILSAPNRVTLNVTNLCNLNCIYCAVSGTKNAAGDLTTEEWKKVIDELAAIKVLRLTLSGGEPFCRPGFPEILAYILSKPFRITINTNGTCFDPESLSLLQGSRRIESVQVSMDGGSAEVHDALRGAGAFDRSVKGIEELKRRHIPFHFFCVVCRANMDHLEQLVKFAKKMKASTVSFCSFIPQGSGLGRYKELALSVEEECRAGNMLRGLRRRYGGLVGGSFLGGIDMFARIAALEKKGLPAAAPAFITSCGGSVKDCSIRPDGRVIACDRLWDLPVGDVRTEPFQKIWLHSEGFTEFRKRFSRRIDSFEECRGCRFVAVCSGGCPAIPFNTGRGFEGWDPLSCYLVYTGEKKSYV